MATGRPVYGDRFNTGNEESALLTRGFQYGTQPGALVIGWNGHHTAVTLPDGTSVSSGEGGGVKIGGLGAYQPQFTHHMYLPMSPDGADMVESAIEDEAPPVENPVEPPVDNDAPAPIEEPVVADVAPVPAVGEPAPAVDAPVMA